MEPIQHRLGIFRPKHDAVNIRRGKRYIPDLPGIHRIAYQNISLENPIEKPVTVKSGDVRPSAATDDHVNFTYKQSW